VEPLVDRLWQRFGAIDASDLPNPVRTVAQQCALDWFGCALAGSREPVARILRDELGDGAGPASVVGTDRRLGVLHAALVNGAAGHALDFDDTNIVMGGHPTAPVLPAALALAEERGATGADLLVSLVVGIEVESRLGVALGPAHYARGWHTTSTVGVVGAAAACSRLLGLDAEQASRAMAIAASQSSGLKANFGTMTKPFHAGHAAERGLLAARLAARGFTADPAALGSEQGLAQAAGDGHLDRDRLARYDDGWITPQTLFKYHAACYLTHAAIEAASALRTEIGDQAIDAVVVTVHPSLLDVCAIPRPATGLEAKFSLAATTALALLGADTTDVATFSDQTATDPAVVDLVGRVSVETDPAVRSTASRVEVRTASGTLERAHDTGVPATDLAAQGARLRSKFLALAAPVVGTASAERLAHDVAGLAELPDVRRLVPVPQPVS